MEHIAINFDREEKGDQMSKNFLAFVGEELKNRFESRGWRFVVLDEEREKGG